MCARSRTPSRYMSRARWRMSWRTGLTRGCRVAATAGAGAVAGVVVGAGATAGAGRVAATGCVAVAGRSADAIRPASSTRHTLATTTSPSTDSGSRYGDAPVSPYLAATPTMCQYDTHAAMPAISAVAASRTAASPRRWTGTRLISSTVTSSATGGHAAIVWEIGFGSACRTLAVTDAATPNARTARTAQRTRRRRTGVTDATPPGSPDGPRPAAPAGAGMRPHSPRETT